MRPGSRAGGKPVKPKAVRRRSSSAAGKEAKVALFKRERDEAQQQQAATAEVLKVISRSTFDLQTVFKTIIGNAVRLCHAHMGAVHLFDGKLVDIVAFHNFPPDAVKVLQSMYPRPPRPDQASGRAILTGQIAQIEDMLADRQYTREVTVAGQWGSILAVPMLRDGAPIGAIVITRNEVGRFADRHIELLKTFADQAGIAIENARLLNELRQSLEQQTATSEVLRVISSSPSELGPIFQTMLANATRLCDATFGLLVLYEGDLRFRMVAMSNAPHAFTELRQREPVFKVSPQAGLGRAVATKDVVHIADYAEEPIYKEQRHPSAVVLGKLGGARTFLVVPMLKDKEITGAIAIYRQEVRPFADKQIELVKSFARQAVIAIENARLLNELRQSLEQQTATSEVLRVISFSRGELEPVFQTMLENATRICDAKFGNLYLCEGDAFRTVAMHNVPLAFAEARKRDPLVHPTPGTPLSRLLNTKSVVHVPDITAEQAYTERNPRIVTAVELGGFRASLLVPMLKEGELVGAIAIYRQELGPFTDKQIALVRTSLRKPSSPSRTHGCLMSCANP